MTPTASLLRHDTWWRKIEVLAAMSAHSPVTTGCGEEGCQTVYMQSQEQSAWHVFHWPYIYKQRFTERRQLLCTSQPVQESSSRFTQLLHYFTEVQKSSSRFTEVLVHYFATERQESSSHFTNFFFTASQKTLARLQERTAYQSHNCCTSR